jgi:hypothetical protein
MKMLVIKINMLIPIHKTFMTHLHSPKSGSSNST